MLKFRKLYTISTEFSTTKRLYIPYLSCLFWVLEIPKFSFSFDFVNDLMVEMKLYTKDIYLSF